MLELRNIRPGRRGGSGMSVEEGRHLGSYKRRHWQRRRESQIHGTRHKGFRRCWIRLLRSGERDVPHRRKRILCVAATADHQIVSVIDDSRSQTLLVPHLLPAEHETAHVQIAEQRTDRSPLRSAPAFIAIARTPMFPPVLIRFLNRSFQPHLDQMQHRPVDDPASHRLKKLGMRNRIEVAA